MHLETERMLVRDFLPGDAADLHAILGDGETMQYSEPAYDLEKTKAFLEDFCIARHGAVAAVEKQSGQVVGYLLFRLCGQGVYEMGWFFRRDRWGRGLAYESCKALRDYAFRELKAHKLFAETIDPVKSVGLMKKLGMKPEGVQRSQTRDTAGHWADLCLYGLLASEWQPE